MDEFLFGHFLVVCSWTSQLTSWASVSSSVRWEQGKLTNCHGGFEESMR